VEDLPSERKEIALLARRKYARFVPRTREMPCDWRPTAVINPETGMPFTDASAWNLIADLAESGHPVKEKILDQPKGEKAFEMEIGLSGNASKIYIKVQVKGGKIFGRSFHCSYRK